MPSMRLLAKKLYQCGPCEILKHFGLNFVHPSKAVNNIRADKLHSVIANH